MNLGVVLKVKQTGEELYKQIFLTKPTLHELKAKIEKKLQLVLSEHSQIVLLPDVLILDDDDVGILSSGDILEIKVST